MTRAKLVMEREIREWQMREKEIQMSTFSERFSHLLMIQFQ